MKKLITIGLSSIWMASMIFSACTKEQLPVPQQSSQADKSFIDPGSGAPVYNYGTLKGVLSPAPYSADIKIYNNKGLSLRVIVQENGTFKVNNLPGDVYDMRILYTVQRGENYYTLYHYITNMVVKDGEVTDLGVIYLPWIY